MEERLTEAVTVYSAELHKQDVIHCSPCQTHSMHRMIGEKVSSMPYSTHSVFVKPPNCSEDYSRLDGPQRFPREKPLGIGNARNLQVGCPSCHPTNSVKTLKVVSDWRKVENLYVNSTSFSTTVSSTCIAIGVACTRV